MPGSEDGLGSGKHGGEIFQENRFLVGDNQGRGGLDILLMALAPSAGSPQMVALNFCGLHSTMQRSEGKIRAGNEDSEGRERNMEWNRGRRINSARRMTVSTSWSNGGQVHQAGRNRLDRRPAVPLSAGTFASGYSSLGLRSLQHQMFNASRPASQAHLFRFQLGHRVGPSQDPLPSHSDVGA